MIMDKLIRTVGQRLAERREAMGFTKQHCAARLGVSYVTITRMEGGSHSSSFELVISYCKLLGITVADLVSEKDLTTIPLGPSPVKLPQQRSAPTRTEILEAMRQVLRLAENPRILKLLDLSEERWTLIERLAEDLSDFQWRAISLIVAAPASKLPGLLMFLEEYKNGANGQEKLKKTKSRA